MEKSCNFCSLHDWNPSSHLSSIFFTQKTGPKAAEQQQRQLRGRRSWRGVKVFLFSLHFLAIKRGGLFVQKCKLLLSQTPDRWYRRVSMPYFPVCRGGRSSMAFAFTHVDIIILLLPPLLPRSSDTCPSLPSSAHWKIGHAHPSVPSVWSLWEQWFTFLYIEATSFDCQKVQWKQKTLTPLQLLLPLSCLCCSSAAFWSRFLREKIDERCDDGFP